MTTAVALPDPSTTTANNNTPPPPPPPPTPPSPRFTLELEFVLSLSNPYYLSHLALTYPHLLNPPPPKAPRTSSSSHRSPTDDNAPSFTTTTQPEPEPESDASRFASYLAYLYSYWRRPEYARFLTHPGATLRNLQLLQQDRFRRDVIRPDVIEKLLAVGTEEKEEEEEEEGEGEGEGEAAGAGAGAGAGAAGAAAGEEGRGEEVKEGMESRGDDDDATAATTAVATTAVATTAVATTAVATTAVATTAVATTATATATTAVAGEQEPKINEAPQEKTAMDVAVG